MLDSTREGEAETEEERDGSGERQKGGERRRRGGAGRGGRKKRERERDPSSMSSPWGARDEAQTPNSWGSDRNVRTQGTLSWRSDPAKHQAGHCPLSWSPTWTDANDKALNWADDSTMTQDLRQHSEAREERAVLNRLSLNPK